MWLPLAERTPRCYRSPGALHDGMNDRQSQTGAAAVARPGLIATIEPLEDVRQCVGVDAAAGVRDGDGAGIAGGFDLYVDVTVIAAVVDRIFQEYSSGSHGYCQPRSSRR